MFHPTCPPVASSREFSSPMEIIEYNIRSSSTASASAALTGSDGVHGSRERRRATGVSRGRHGYDGLRRSAIDARRNPFSPYSRPSAIMRAPSACVHSRFVRACFRARLPRVRVVPENSNASVYSGALGTGSHSVVFQ